MLTDACTDAPMPMQHVCTNATLHLADTHTSLHFHDSMDTPSYALAADSLLLQIAKSQANNQAL